MNRKEYFKRNRIIRSYKKTGYGREGASPPPEIPSPNINSCEVPNNPFGKGQGEVSTTPH
jgi:hypothetical protein